VVANFSSSATGDMATVWPLGAVRVSPRQRAPGYSLAVNVHG